MSRIEELAAACAALPDAQKIALAIKLASEVREVDQVAGMMRLEQAVTDRVSDLARARRVARKIS